MMSFKLKTMFEAKMKALLGENLDGALEDAEAANDSIGKEDELNATGDLLSQGDKPSITAKSGKQTT